MAEWAHFWTKSSLVGAQKKFQTALLGSVGEGSYCHFSQKRPKNGPFWRFFVIFRIYLDVEEPVMVCHRCPARQKYFIQFQTSSWSRHWKILTLNCRKTASKIPTQNGDFSKTVYISPWERNWVLGRWNLDSVENFGSAALFLLISRLLVCRLWVSSRFQSHINQKSGKEGKKILPPSRREVRGWNFSWN